MERLTVRFVREKDFYKGKDNLNKDFDTFQKTILGITFHSWRNFEYLKLKIELDNPELENLIKCANDGLNFPFYGVVFKYLKGIKTTEGIIKQISTILDIIFEFLDYYGYRAGLLHNILFLNELILQLKSFGVEQNISMQECIIKLQEKIEFISKVFKNLIPVTESLNKIEKGSKIISTFGKFEATVEGMHYNARPPILLVGEYEWIPADAVRTVIDNTVILKDIRIARGDRFTGPHIGLYTLQVMECERVIKETFDLNSSRIKNILWAKRDIANYNRDFGFKIGLIPSEDIFTNVPDLVFYLDDDRLIYGWVIDLQDDYFYKNQYESNIPPYLKLEMNDKLQIELEKTRYYLFDNNLIFIEYYPLLGRPIKVAYLLLLVTRNDRGIQIYIDKGGDLEEYSPIKEASERFESFMTNLENKNEEIKELALAEIQKTSDISDLKESDVDNEKISRFLKVIVKKLPKSLIAWLGLAFYYEGNNYFEEAIQFYQKALEILLHDYKILFRVAKLFEELQNYRKAEEFYEKALSEINKGFNYARLAFVFGSMSPSPAEQDHQDPFFKPIEPWNFFLNQINTKFLFQTFKKNFYDVATIEFPLFPALEASWDESLEIGRLVKKLWISLGRVNQHLGNNEKAAKYFATANKKA